MNGEMGEDMGEHRLPLDGTTFVEAAPPPDPFAPSWPAALSNDLDAHADTYDVTDVTPGHVSAAAATSTPYHDRDPLPHLDDARAVP